MNKKLFSDIVSIVLVVAFLSGCSKEQGKTADDLKAFSGANGKMPTDAKAKMEAAQRNGAAQAPPIPRAPAR